MAPNGAMRFLRAGSQPTKSLEMKHSISLLLALALVLVLVLVALPLAQAEQIVLQTEDDSEVVVKRGAATITLHDIDAAVESVPFDKRANFMDSPRNIERLLEGLIMDRQLAERARELGLDQDPTIAAQLRLALDRALARRYLDDWAAKQQEPDFGPLARERYMATPQRFSIPASVDVRHVLVTIEKHGEARAREIAETVLAKARAGEDFAQLVENYSEDTEAGRANGGLLRNVMPNQTSPGFEEAAFALSEPGQLSEVVRSDFGFHVLRLEQRRAARVRPYEQVRDAIISELREDFRKNAREQHLSEFQGETFQLDPDLLASLRGRYAPGGVPPVEAIRQHREELLKQRQNAE